ncbi:hypothetical protein [Bradyrhizobium japonicum]|uniref:hypothetical protein n=1 Tax=Bradyrhizobium japonicum TaxID=375 RepID=UPI0013748125|nr:hypothetical protein [Bradyrhizobium japonicum]
MPADRRLFDSSSMTPPPAPEVDAVKARRLDSEEVDALLRGRTIVPSTPISATGADR